MAKVIAMNKVSLAHAKDRLSELIRQAEAGTEVLITRRAKVVARLVSEAEYQQLRRRSAVAGLQAMRDRFKAAGLSAQELHRRSREELEERG